MAVSVHTHTIHGGLTETLQQIRQNLALLHITYLIEPSEKNGAHHAGDIKPKPGQKPSTLKGDIRSPHNQGLAWGVLEGEDVIAGDAILLGSRNVRETGATTLKEGNRGGGQKGEGHGEGGVVSRYQISQLAESYVVPDNSTSNMAIHYCVAFLQPPTQTSIHLLAAITNVFSQL